MPIRVHAELRRPTEEEFRRVAYHVVGTAFELHTEFGPFFDEKIYQRELAFRIDSVQREVAVELTFGDFIKTCYLDLLVDNSCIFELKTVEKLQAKHHGQLLNYLFICDLPRGKLINFRSESVEHQFVNATLCASDRRDFEIDDANWNGGGQFRHLIIEILRDWGTALANELYTKAVTHCLGGEDQVVCDVPIIANDRLLGHQKVHLATTEAAFKITSLHWKKLADFEHHLRCFASRTPLKTIHWINIRPKEVTFKTINV